MQKYQEKQNQSSSRKSSPHFGSTPHSELIVMDRNFNVPVQKLFKAFTTAEVLKIWWWPKGLWADNIDLHFREGGKYFINMKGYEKGGGGMTGEFETIIENECIVMTDQFSDENGNPVSAEKAQMPGVWPKLIFITFDFESVDENTSRFKLSQQGIPNELQKDCIQGWTESFDKLENYLNGRKN